VSNRSRFREHPVRTSLQRHVASPPNNGENRERARQLWQECGVLLVWPDQHVGGWPERTMLDNVGNRLYGPRLRER
jgi:hypothetical protein